MNDIQAKPSHYREAGEINLLSPLTLRDVTLRNRIAMPPMCQYSAREGFANDWHLVHLGSRAAGGAGLVMVEATAVTRDGRISPGDMGIWSDAHIEPLARHRTLRREPRRRAPAFRLAHAGRKASCDRALAGGGRRLRPTSEGGWPVIGPERHSLQFEADPAPIAARSSRHRRDRRRSFEAAAGRALAAAFQVIEIHAAHGYLLHEFLSPLSQSPQRCVWRQPGEPHAAAACASPKRSGPASRAELPVFMRISATDWVKGGWDIEQSIEFARRAKERGVDLIDVSSGALVPDAKVPVGKGFQVPLRQAHSRRGEDQNRGGRHDHRRRSGRRDCHRGRRRSRHDRPRASAAALLCASRASRDRRQAELACPIRLRGAA